MPPFSPDRNNSNRNNRNNPNNNNNINREMPLGPPPSRIPQQPAQMQFGAGPGARSVNPSSIRNCVGSFTYIWMSNGQEFWMFPVQVWGDSVAGFRWNRRTGWSYVGISLSRIDMFSCSA